VTAPMVKVKVPLASLFRLDLRTGDPLAPVTPELQPSSSLQFSR